MPSEQFIRSLKLNLTYWQDKVKALDDQTIVALDGERQNLFRAIQFGLVLPQTCEATLDLALHLFHLVERRGYWQEGIALWENIGAHCTAVASPSRFKLFYQIGHLHRLNHNLPQAIRAHKEAEAVARQMNDPLLLAEAQFGLSLNLWHSLKYDEAEQVGLSALKKFVELAAEQKWTAATLNTLGVVARDRGELAVAQQRLSQAVALWRPLHQPTELARALNNLATVLQNLNQFEEALRCYQESFDLLEQGVSRHDRIMVQISLGSLYYQMDRLSEAETLFRQVDLTYLQQSGHVFYQALIAQNLGNVLLKLGQLEEAEKQLCHGVTLWRRMNNNIYLGNALGTLAEALAEMGQDQTAVAHYDEAIVLLKQHPDDAWAGKLLVDFAAQRQLCKQ